VLLIYFIINIDRNKFNLLY